MVRIRRELSFIIKNIGLIGFAAFICAFFGIILWVNGNNIWYIMKTSALPDRIPDVTGIFTVWLISYGLYGIMMALVFLHVKCGIIKMSVIPFSFASAGYLFCLIWYALFFNTSLTLFASIILFFAILMTIAVFFLMRRGFIILKIVLLLIATVELYFIYFSLAFYLLN